MRSQHLALAAALIAPVALAQTPTSTAFTHLATIDLFSTSVVGNPEFIGTNPSGVAWNGSRLFIAGFHNLGSAGPVALLEVLDPLGTPTYGPVFGLESANPALRGYSGLDIKGNRLAAAYDDGATDPHGLGVWDVSNSASPANVWFANARGGSGVGFDPGYQGVDLGTGWTTFGSGRRALNNENSGATIYDGTTGLIMQVTGQTSTFWRDMDFDDATGDIYLRKGNNVVRVPRTGGNSTSGGLQIVDETDWDFGAGQNIAFISSPYGDRVIYNERNNGSNTQDFFTQVRVVTPAGAAHTVNWGTFTPLGLGTAWYDFSWDEASGTLAVLDFGRRAAYIFRLEPPTETFNYCTAGTSTNGCVATLSATGVASASQATPFAITINNIEGQKNGIMFYGIAGPSALAWGSGPSFLCVKPPTQRTGGQFSGGTILSCDGTMTLDWNAWMTANPAALGSPYVSGDAFWVQGWYRDPPAPKTTNLSDGLQFFLSL